MRASTCGLMTSIVIAIWSNVAGIAQSRPVPTTATTLAIPSGAVEAEIMPRYELISGEAIQIRLRVVNRSQDPLILLHIDRLLSNAAFKLDVFNSAGKLIPSGGPYRRRFSEFRPDQNVILAPGRWMEGLLRASPSRLEGPGVYQVRASYEPVWKDSPVITRDFDLNVIPLAPAIVDRKPVPGKAPGARFVTEILKVRTRDGYWLFSKSSEEPTIGRLMQVNEKATFAVSPPAPLADRPAGQISVTVTMDGQKSVLQLDYEVGTPVTEEPTVNSRVEENKRDGSE